MGLFGKSDAEINHGSAFFSAAGAPDGSNPATSFDKKRVSDAVVNVNERGERLERCVLSIVEVVDFERTKKAVR